jgi:hypothetical protein
MGLVYDPRRLPKIITAMPAVDGVLQGVWRCGGNRRPAWRRPTSETALVMVVAGGQAAVLACRRGGLNL